MADFNVDEFIKANFDHYRQAGHWHWKALSLRRSAALLYSSMKPEIDRYVAALEDAHSRLDESGGNLELIMADEPDLMCVYLLHGYSIENILKALLIHQNPKLLQSDTIDWSGKGHGLRQFARRAKLALTDRQRAVLHWMEDIVVWKGRYSVPLKAEHFTSFWAFDHYDRGSIEITLTEIDDIFAAANRLLPFQGRSLDDGGVLVRM